ncbi:MAG: alpha-E domain-containing protein [Vicinamibacterales bacterium]
MLSRVADCFYWMSRYIERAEQSARVLDVQMSLTLDDPSATVAGLLLSGIAPPPAGFASALMPTAQGLERIDPRHYAAVAGCVAAARDNARQIREQISAEMWEQLNTMYLDISRSGRRDASEFTSDIIRDAYLFHGVTEATLSHGEAWHYVQLGRSLERAASTAAMLQVYFTARPAGEDADAGSYVERVGLLRAHAAFEAYCRCYTAELRPERLAEFLLLNAELPQSVRFAADRIEESLRAVARSLSRRPDGQPDRLAGKLRSALNYGTIDEIIEDDLLEYLASIQKQCRQIHSAIYQTYIAYPIETAIAR